MINDLQYTVEVEGTNEGAELEKGKVIGEVEYEMPDNACFNHKMKNGDAAFLPVGTEIYSIKGYNADFRVLADEKVYQVRENPRAQTIADLYNIEGKVAKEDEKRRKKDRPYVFPSQRSNRLTEAGVHHWFRGLKKKPQMSQQFFENEIPEIRDLDNY
ncbi:hypothetical protein [Alteribacillus bidgolensis]|nr:hypothetical protein [Alteribacillus bidgolensis]